MTDCSEKSNLVFGYGLCSLGAIAFFIFTGTAALAKFLSSCFGCCAGRWDTLIILLFVGAVFFIAWAVVFRILIYNTEKHNGN